jgi:hypothetical protein
VTGAQVLSVQDVRASQSAAVMAEPLDVVQVPSLQSSVSMVPSFFMTVTLPLFLFTM